MEKREQATGLRPDNRESQVLAEVLRAVREIRHGCVQIVIQDSRVVQIDRTEKVRLSK